MVLAVLISNLVVARLGRSPLQQGSFPGGLLQRTDADQFGEKAILTHQQRFACMKVLQCFADLLQLKDQFIFCHGPAMLTVLHFQVVEL